MSDIRYFWRDGLSSVGMSSEVELPQFRVLGHRQRATEINLTTGIKYRHKNTYIHTHTQAYTIHSISINPSHSQLNTQQILEKFYQQTNTQPNTEFVLKCTQPHLCIIPSTSDNNFHNSHPVRPTLYNHSTHTFTNNTSFDSARRQTKLGGRL